MKKILIIAHARMKGGLSGSDAIYENFVKHWPVDADVWTMLNVDFKPFWLCYTVRYVLAILRAMFCFKKYDLVYSASDFGMDVCPALWFKMLRKTKWVAGFYLLADKSNKAHYSTQIFAKKIIAQDADMVIVTNQSMYDIFPNKPKTWINGGVDFSLAGPGDKERIYDAVFCGRIHPSKGIDELINIWDVVRRYKPMASMALIGDGDLGREYIEKELLGRYGHYNGITLLGYMGNERYSIYKKSKVVLYPAVWNHFSMAPVEAMACGCPMVMFALPIINDMVRNTGFEGYVAAPNTGEFALNILGLIDPDNFPRLLVGGGENGTKLLNYAEISDKACVWAQQFDYKKQVMRVFDDIKKEVFGEDISDRRKGNGGTCHSETVGGVRTGDNR